MHLHMLTGKVSERDVKGKEGEIRAVIGDKKSIFRYCHVCDGPENMDDILRLIRTCIQSDTLLFRPFLIRPVL